jgi:hypothetical protein
MGKFDAAWSTGDLAKAVCDELVSNGLLREKPAFIREDREKKLTQIFAAAKLDGASMATMNGRGVEMAVRSEKKKCFQCFCSHRPRLICAVPDGR